MDITALFFRYYFLVLLVLLPGAVFALAITRLEKTRPRVVQALSAVLVGLLVVLAVAECIRGLLQGSFTGSMVLHLSISLAAALALWAKAREGRSPKPGSKEP